MFLYILHILRLRRVDLHALHLPFRFGKNKFLLLLLLL